MNLSSHHHQSTTTTTTTTTISGTNSPLPPSHTHALACIHTYTPGTAGTIGGLAHQNKAREMSGQNSRKGGLISRQRTQAVMVEGSGPGATLQRSGSTTTGSTRPTMDDDGSLSQHVNRRGDGRRAGMGMPVSSAADVLRKPTTDRYALEPSGTGTGAGGPVLLGEDLDLGESVTHVLDEDSTDDESLGEGDAVADRQAEGNDVFTVEDEPPPSGQAEGNDVFTEEDEPPPPQRRKTLAPAERKQTLSKEVSSVTLTTSSVPDTTPPHYLLCVVYTRTLRHDSEPPTSRTYMNAQYAWHAGARGEGGEIPGGSKENAKRGRGQGQTDGTHDGFGVTLGPATVSLMLQLRETAGQRQVLHALWHETRAERAALVADGQGLRELQDRHRWAERESEALIEAR